MDRSAMAATGLVVTLFVYVAAMLCFRCATLLSDDDY